MPVKAKRHPQAVQPREESWYRIRCHQCGVWCRTMPESLDGSGLPSIWWCDCTLPDDPESALLLCTQCMKGHVCPRVEPAPGPGIP